MRATILIVDDNPSFRENLHALLSQEYQVRQAGSAEEAYEQLARGDVELVLLDLYLNGRVRDRSGFEVLQSIRRDQTRPIGVIMFTVEHEVATVVEAMKLGADDYLSKDCSDEELLIVVSKLIDHVRLQRAHLLAERQSQDEADRIIGQSPALLKILEEVDRIADKEVQVLIIGASGTGKELIARRLHDISWRKKQKQPFVAVNCTAIPEELAESELFGHEKGAFTSAGQTRIGKFEVADQGTLLLDEVDSMPLSIQAKLLRVLEDRTFERIGGNHQIVFRARVVAAAKRDLRETVAAGRFREDLYYRLNGMNVFLPPLRRRPQDIPLLIAYFLQKFNQKHGLMIRQVEEEAMQHLVAYHWPGNVRQLRRELERIFTLAEPGTRCISLSMFSEDIRQAKISLPHELQGTPLASLTLPQAVELVKRQMITEALKKSDGKRAEAARKLGITRRGLQKMMRRFSQGE